MKKKLVNKPVNVLDAIIKNGETIHEDEETVRFIYRPPKMDQNEPLYQNLETKEGYQIKFINSDGKEVEDLTDGEWIANFTLKDEK